MEVGRGRGRGSRTSSQRRRGSIGKWHEQETKYVAICGVAPFPACSYGYMQIAGVDAGIEEAGRGRSTNHVEALTKQGPEGFCTRESPWFEPLKPVAFVSSWWLSFQPLSLSSTWVSGKGNLLFNTTISRISNTEAQHLVIY